MHLHRRCIAPSSIHRRLSKIVHQRCKDEPGVYCSRRVQGCNASPFHCLCTSGALHLATPVPPYLCTFAVQSHSLCELTKGASGKRSGVGVHIFYTPMVLLQVQLVLDTYSFAAIHLDTECASHLCTPGPYGFLIHLLTISFLFCKCIFF